jgi:hypothetical protein
MLISPSDDIGAERRMRSYPEFARAGKGEFLNRVGEVRSPRVQPASSPAITYSCSMA